MRERDKTREERILMEAIVDANGPEEQAMGWYYYLEDKISFPFTASCIAVNKRTPLDLSEQINVLGMAEEDYCEHECS